MYPAPEPPNMAEPYLHGIVPKLAGYALEYDTGSILGMLADIQFNSYFHEPSKRLESGVTASIQARAFAESLHTRIFSPTY